MKHYRLSFFLFLLLPFIGWAQESHILSLPRLEQLSSQRVLQVIQDSEGFLWYATEGGGLCCDDGLHITVFRSDAEHPDLLGSNDIASVAETDGRYVIIGTFHGAYLLDKSDYSIKKLKEVDDKRVDDIIVSRNGHWWLTANKKIYEYDGNGSILNTYLGGSKYMFRLHEDREGQIWAAEWDGGLLRLEDNRLVEAPWPLNNTPSSIEDDPSDVENLLIGTLGCGVVKYNSKKGIVKLTEPSDSVCISRVSYDLQGRMLVADGHGKCYVKTIGKQQPWFKNQILTKFIADSIRNACGLSTRPTAIAYNESGELWFSTGKDIRCMKQNKEDVVLPDTKDVSAMTFTKDGKLWLATIFGTVMTYKDGNLTVDDYASNEHGDAVVALQTDSMGRLVIVCDHYVRLYDQVNNSLRQQSVEDDGVYRVELQETRPGERWTHPEQEVVERLPQWVWWLLALLFIVMIILVVQVLILHRHRRQFLAVMKKQSNTMEQPAEEQPVLNDEWLKKSIDMVESHIADYNYSVEQLASDMCMSRMTLYRKIKSTTGQKPTEFIRTIRLRRASEMLREKNMSVTEVSYATGFSSVSYFCRCFRTMFGVPPTQLGKINTAEDRSPKEMPNWDSVE